MLNNLQVYSSIQAALERQIRVAFADATAVAARASVALPKRKRVSPTRKMWPSLISVGPESLRAA